jgi:phosphate butyryltransferase
MRTMDELIMAASLAGRLKLAVAAAQESSVLEAVELAYEAGIAEPILVGDPELIAEAARQAKGGKGIDISRFEIIAQKDIASSALKAVELVRTGRAGFLMKGLLDSSVMLKAILNRETGINLGKLVSHVAVLEVGHYHKLLVITDAAINIAPTLDGFIDIIESAVQVARAIGVKVPKVALLAAVEKVYPEKMPCTATAAILTQMNKRGQIKGCIIDGPLALDLAISAESARIKNIASEVAGDADILVVPTIEAGNILYKCLVDLAGARGAGIGMGAAKPVVLTSRADTAEIKLASIALAALVGRQEG